MSNSSDEEEEGEFVPDSVTNYHFVNSQNALTSFSVLPLYWNDNDNGNVIGDGDVRPTVVSLLGNSDGGLQSVFKEVIGWKFDLSFLVPEVYMLFKGRKWIRLDKPRKSYQGVVSNVLIVVQFLHFAKRNVEASRDEIACYLKKFFSLYDVVEPLETCLSANVALIKTAVAHDKDLAKSKYIEAFLMEIENPGRKETLDEENPTTNKSNFKVSDEDVEIEDDFDDEPEGLFDSVCAYCDNGGDVLICEGKCLRSFHPTIATGVDTRCESLGFENAAQYEAIANFFCNNCKHQKHQCFVCGKLGSSDKSSAVEVFPCVSATCGHFYHPACVAKLLYPSDETLAKELKSQIATGESFTCPIHKCHRCHEGENKDVHELQFAVCRRCPKSYHRKCLPDTIAFKGSDDGTIEQRAWDNLLPNRILMYCKKHMIIPSIATPRRDHLLFPSVQRKRNQDGSKIEVMTERKSNAFGNFKDFDTRKKPKIVENRCKTVTYGDPAMEKSKSSTLHKKTSALGNNMPISRNSQQPSNNMPISRKSQQPSQQPSNNMPISRNSQQPSNNMPIARNLQQPSNNMPISRNSQQPSNMARFKLPYKDIPIEQHYSSKPLKKRFVITPPKIDDDIKKRIMKLVKDTTSSFDFEEFIKEKKRKCTHEIYTPQSGLDKTITMGKVEASVKAVKEALKILENGGSVEDAKAVCEPNVLNQLMRWKKKLQVFLAPFLHGARYTSFGRHFTKVDKLNEIVERLHWYVEDGDTIVDFCCGSNDFSCFMKAKLDSMGKRCNFKNFDLITPKNSFEFERRDWFSVSAKDLTYGSRLVIGLNPPFGVQASLANKFIDHALKFKPKLLILIVPEETRRLDQKRSPYDLIWEETDMLSGKSFYLPGSVGIQNQPLDDWNVKPPPLSLWSHPRWTAKHKEIAQKYNHTQQYQERKASNYLMEDKHDCYRDFSNVMTEYKDNIVTILDDVPEEPEPDGKSNQSLVEDTNMTSDTGTHIPGTDEVMVDMDISSPVISSTNSRSEPRAHPSHYEHYPVISSTYSRSEPRAQPSHYEHYGPPVPYGPGTEFRYSLPGQTAYPTHPGSSSHYANYNQGDFTRTSMHHPYANYGYPTYPTNTSVNPPGPTFTYGQPTSEPNVWPPGTNPPGPNYY